MNNPLTIALLLLFIPFGCNKKTTEICCKENQQLDTKLFESNLIFIPTSWNCVSAKYSKIINKSIEITNSEFNCNKSLSSEFKYEYLNHKIELQREYLIDFDCGENYKLISKNDFTEIEIISQVIVHNKKCAENNIKITIINKINQK